mgnify:CR=1 FL=1
MRDMISDIISEWNPLDTVLFKLDKAIAKWQ